MTERKLLTIMLVVFAIVVIGTLLFLATAVSEDLYILCNPHSKVNIRSKPNNDSRVVAWIECGQCVHADGREKNGYVHVIDLPAEETSGWIYSGYLVWEQPRIREFRAEVWEGDVIARSCVDGKRLRKLKEGKLVTVYAQTNRWAVTNKGFVMCDWLKEVE